MDLRRSRGKYSSIDRVPVSAIVSGASDMHMHEIIPRPNTLYKYSSNDNRKNKRREWHDNKLFQRMNPSMAPPASDRSQ